MAKSSTYLGHLTPSQAAEGMSVALRNARRLTADAEILFRAGSWPTATSLALLAIEEAGKVKVLREIVMASTASDLKAAWARYTAHGVKLAAPIGMSGGGRSLADPKVLAEVVADHRALITGLNGLKQAGLYTDCMPSVDGGPQWREPALAVSAQQAFEAVAGAIETTGKLDVAVRDVELMLEHIAPVQGTPGIVAGWQAFLQALEAEGLLHEPREAIEERVYRAFLGDNWRNVRAEDIGTVTSGS